MAANGFREVRCDTAVKWMLDWLDDQETWQDRWLASGADADGRHWRHIPVAWLGGRGRDQTWMQDWFFRALFTAFGADVIRPSLNWLVAANFRRGILTHGYRRREDDHCRIADRIRTAGEDFVVEQLLLAPLPVEPFDPGWSAPRLSLAGRRRSPTPALCSHR